MRDNFVTKNEYVVAKGGRPAPVGPSPPSDIYQNHQADSDAMSENAGSTILVG